MYSSLRCGVPLQSPAQRKNVRVYKNVFMLKIYWFCFAVKPTKFLYHENKKN